MSKFISSFIRLIISLGKFGLVIYTLSLIDISLASNDNLRYLKSGSPMLKLSATYIQDRTNSNVKRRIKKLALNNYEKVISWDLYLHLFY